MAMEHKYVRKDYNQSYIILYNWDSHLWIKKLVAATAEAAVAATSFLMESRRCQGRWSRKTRQ